MTALAPGDFAPERLGSLVVARRGTVVSFDDEAGLGVVEDEAGRQFPFHCTSIAGGVRTIAVGAAVDFSAAAGVGGRFEGRDLRPL